MAVLCVCRSFQHLCCCLRDTCVAVLLFARLVAVLASMEAHGAPLFTGSVARCRRLFCDKYIAHKTLLPAYSQQGWYFYKYERGTNADGTPRVLDSYWKNPQGFDKGEPDQQDYIFHSTVGHHGLFSLTPVWALSLLGLGIWLFDRRYRCMAMLILITSVVVFAFYMTLPLELRNYGGNTSALRWLFWLAPLWSVALVAAADQFSKHAVFRAIALVCLLVSVMSAAYPLWNPWSMPWTYNLMLYVGG